ncbi:hypothetical protein ACFFUB_07785 [Algimonas porphyrae]|uniref:PepSY domain-containing protein n=1 Tax=Algimonas porphyrae TaxID=1128113 RepID=A0ABQ5V047_9PROT|nr:hypothetical protein [Algimonas porphyrae]GLQ20925.1 hypothetical protein GCM10007854_18800 [Algimonas porphyrae]
MAALISPAWKLRLLKWHRWLTLLLLAQLGIWLCSALVMTMIARSSLTAYAPPPAPSFDAASSWPDLDALSGAAPTGAARVQLALSGPTPQLTVDAADPISPETLSPPVRIEADRIATLASAMTGEAITPEQVSLKTRNSVEYQKLPVPAWRVEAEDAVIFFSPTTGDYITQTTRMRFLENLATTIHIMDYSGGAVFRRNVVLTFFALLFFSTALFGVLAVRKLYLRKRPIPKTMKIHQILGLVLSVQVVLWVSSGLGVVWLLHPLRDQAEAVLRHDPAPIDWTAVTVHPRDIIDPADARGTPVEIVLRMLGDGPVYAAKWPGRNPDQALWSARDGQALVLTETDRDAIVAKALVPEAAASIERWEVAEGPQDLDFYFYTGPYPVWKAYFTEPLSGAVAIDQVTGHVHTPRTGNEIFLERYYNVHVVNWRFRVVQYRREPVLIIVILLAMALFVTGVVLHVRRWKRTGSVL